MENFKCSIVIYNLYATHTLTERQTFTYESVFATVKSKFYADDKELELVAISTSANTRPAIIKEAITTATSNSQRLIVAFNSHNKHFNLIRFLGLLASLMVSSLAATKDKAECTAAQASGVGRISGGRMRK